MVQGTVDVESLTGPQVQFTVTVMGMVMDKLIQDSMDLDEAGQPLPAMEQEDPTIRQAMQILNYK